MAKNNLSTDNGTCPNINETCPIAIRQVSNVSNGNCGTVKAETSQVPQFDSREKLEADVRKWFINDYYDDYYNEEDMNSVVSKWLDRQAAITKMEMQAKVVNNETTLLPCPFCGGEAHIHSDYSSERDKTLWNIWHECHEHDGKSRGYGHSLSSWFETSWYDTETEAIAAWNTRAELGRGTCEPNWILQGETQTQEFWRCECGNCGECFGVETRESFPFKVTIDKVDIPNFCLNCGKRIRKKVDG